MRSFGILLLVLPLFAWAAPAEDLGDLLIRYDETPVPMEGGSMVWKGATRIKLTLKDGKLSGKGVFAYRYDGKVEACTSACTASSSASVSGTVLGDLGSLTLSFPRSTVSCKVKCPRGAGFASNTPVSARKDKFNVSMSSNAELPWKPEAEGPTLYYRVEPLCTPQAGKAPAVELSALPVGVNRLTLLTLLDVRNHPPTNSDRYGLTFHPFDAPIALATKAVKPRRGTGMCLWVEELRVGLKAIEVRIPGINYPENSCEFKAVDAHEAQHVASYQTLLAGFSDDLRKTLEAAPVPWATRPIRVNDSASARAALHTQLDELVAPIGAQWVGHRKAADARLDTPAEYARVHALCRQW